MTTDSAAGVQVYRAGPDGADEPVGSPFAAAIDRGRLDVEWVVPDQDVLAPRVADTALYFRLVTGDEPESAPSPLLYVENPRSGDLSSSRP
jgi:hypothetical protein